MNPFWMALIAVFTVVEKQLDGSVSQAACGRDTACVGRCAASNVRLDSEGTSDGATKAGRSKGELVLSCNCTVFCPCVLSLGSHPPTEGYCQTWAGFRIDPGHFGEVDLSGLNARAGHGDPRLYEPRQLVGRPVHRQARLDLCRQGADAASSPGKAGGTTALLSILVGKFLGVEQVPITYETQGRTRHFQIPKIIDGAVTPIRGKERDGDTMISNSEYWIAPEIIVARADKSRMRAFGRNWNFAGRSAEICKLDWRGP